MRSFTIVNPKNDREKELVYQWSDGTTTDIIYDHRGYLAKHDKRNIDEQINTYGESAGKELAEYYALHHKQLNY